MTDRPATADDPSAVADVLRRSERAVCLTGAGVSTASGIPSFRGEDGIWGRQFHPRDFEIGRFRRDPEGFWRNRLRLHETMYPDDLEPNAAHEALARLGAVGALDAVITQNTDGLHAAAGSERVLELHGTARRVVCTDCGARFDATPVRNRARAGELPPRCADCDGVLKPNVVLFGESLPTAVFDEARSLVASSDAVLVVGSSLVVEPAASLPLEAPDATLVVCNLEETGLSSRADVDLRADATDVLPRVVDLVER